MKNEERKRIIIDPITPFTEKVSHATKSVAIGIFVIVLVAIVLLIMLISGVSYVIESVFVSIARILENIGLGFFVKNLKIFLFVIIFPGFEQLSNKVPPGRGQYLIGYFALTALSPLLSVFIMNRFVGRFIGTLIIALFFNVTLYFLLADVHMGIDRALLGFGFLAFLALLSGFLAALITRREIGPKIAYLVLCLIILVMVGHILDPLGFYNTTTGEAIKQSFKENLTIPGILLMLLISLVLYSIPVAFLPEKE